MHGVRKLNYQAHQISEVQTAVRAKEEGVVDRLLGPDTHDAT